MRQHRKPFTDEEKVTIWDDHQAGVPRKRFARNLGRENSAPQQDVGDTPTTGAGRVTSGA